MPQFTYKTIERDGSIGKGRIEAMTEKEARHRLFDEKIAFVSLLEERVVRKKKELPLPLLLFFFKDLLSLLTATVPLYTALRFLEEKYRKQSKLHPLLLTLLEKVKSGFSLSAALRDASPLVPKIYFPFIESGEKTGSLNKGLSELIVLLTKQQKGNKELINTFLYPGVLFCFALGVVGLLFFYLLPSLEDLYSDRKTSALTAFLFRVSRGLIWAKPYLMMGFFGLLSGLLILHKKGVLSTMCKAAIFRIPYVRDIALKMGLSRFFYIFAALLTGGVSVIEAIREAKGGFEMLKAPLESIEKRLLEGSSLEEAFSVEPLPRLVSHLVSIAEEGGNLPFVTAEIGRIYEEEVEGALKAMATFAQPLLLLFLAALIAMVLLSVLLPLTDVSSFIET